MKLITLAAVVLFGGGMLLQAQFAPPVAYDAASVDSLVRQTQLDLNSAYGRYHFVAHGDRDRLNHAEKELREFSAKWDGGHFDKGELDDAISAIQRVLNNNPLHVGERDALTSDISQLRRMREAYNRNEIRGAYH